MSYLRDYFYFSWSCEFACGLYVKVQVKGGLRGQQILFLLSSASKPCPLLRLVLPFASEQQTIFRKKCSHKGQRVGTQWRSQITYFKASSKPLADHVPLWICVEIRCYWTGEMGSCRPSNKGKGRPLVTVSFTISDERHLKPGRWQALLEWK